MKLLKLTLDNFQGIPHIEITPDGKNTSIYGDNATGKTTVYNAYTWLLFDRASNGAKNYNPKTLTADGEAHNLIHSAEAMFDTITLRKEFHEVYKAVKGKADKTFSGHTTDYYVNGVPTTQKEYESAIVSEFGDIETLKILSMQDYFADTMSWQNRRNILIDIIGNVSDDDVYAANEELNDLKALTNNHTVDETRKIADAERKKINEELKAIPIRIDEANKSRSGLTEAEANKYMEESAKAQAEIDRLTAEKTDANNSQLAAEININIAKLNAELSDARARYTDDISESKTQAHEKSNLLYKEIQLRQDRCSKLQKQTDDLQRQIDNATALRTALIDEWKKTKALEWDESKNICPTCKRELPAKDIEKLKRQFNTEKSNKLAEITKRADKEASKDIIEKLTFKINGVYEDWKTENKKIADLQAQKDKLTEQFGESALPFEMTEKFKDIATKINIEHGKLAELQNKADTVSDGLDRQMLEYKAVVNEAMQMLARYKNDKNTLARIEELEKREKDLAEEFEKCERTVFLCEEFIRTKITMITDKINEKFNHVKFRLFAEQVNGGIAETCDVMIPSECGNYVPYGFANRAAQINAGIEIISILSKHYGKSIPLFVDNAEAVTKLYNADDCQVIRLVVSEADKQLRITA